MQSSRTLPPSSFAAYLAIAWTRALVLPVALTLALVVSAVGCGPNSTAQRTAVDLEPAGGRAGHAGGATGGASGASGGSGGSTQPPRAINGTICAAPKDCQSGQCVDGRCCETACEGVCQACDLPGTEGRCSPVPADTDPANECEAEPATSCGRDGACNGAGACRKQAAGVMCAVGGCDVATQRAASTCDGMGTCQPGMTKSCAPAVCLGDSCGDPCAVDADCKMTGFFCASGTCRAKRDMAATCDADNQCTSGFCADGVCCATACKDKCQTCNGEGKAGTCSPIATGLDPDNECPVQGITTCGNAGGCDGKGGCRQHQAGTFCGPASCTGSTVTDINTCDGKGACKPGPKHDCSPYLCNGASCWTACSTKDQCKAGKACVVNVCE
jgi:hypothetical protein